MDTALKLKIDIDNGINISNKEAVEILKQSELVSKLTHEINDSPLSYVWRIIALSEIPFSQHLDFTKNLIDRIYQKLSAPFGFSLSGDEKNFLPCYNAMLISALCRLGRAGDKQVKDAIEWIVTYQPMERGMEVSIPNFNFDRFGGCFKATPCYIGLAKSVIALFEYQQSTGDSAVNPKLEQGVEYMLKHNLFKRLNKDQPITDHILDISFPESYHLNIVELIRFAGKANLLTDSRTDKAVKYLEKKRLNNGQWKVTYRYKANDYIIFDQGRKPGDWVSYIISRALNEKTKANII
ncbi:hypothetical protein [Mariniflexile sp. HMF6888]|uniref:hypothetical protein n=1 Tax=Mariniflexile sp. HMF6888 TaxID=3373086 RepID=UPI00378D4035